MFLALFELVICALFHNEELFLKEWIDYHRSVGVEHFYLYDHKSDDRSLEILQPYIEDGIVDLFKWPIDIKNQEEYLYKLQIPIYNNALKIVQKTSKWAAFIDIDEFIVPIYHDTIPNLLEEYKSYGGLAVNWQMFGPANFEEIPEKKKLIETLVWKANPFSMVNRTVKMIVQPSFVRKVLDPHFFDFVDGFFAVDSNFLQLPARHRTQEVVIDKVQINHYWCGTKKWFFSNKLPRLTNWGLPLKPATIEEIFHDYSTTCDPVIFRFLKKEI